MNPGVAVSIPEDIEITGKIIEDFSEILTREALIFIAELERSFRKNRLALLNLRVERQKKIDSGINPEFLEATRVIREDNWKIEPVPADLQDRSVEITGPVERKIMINALNSGANIFMADFEDSNSPTWENVIQGQINLRDAIGRTLSLSSPEGKTYKLNKKTATLIVRPRGLHLTEKHVLIDDKPISASIFDFGLYFFHNAKKLIEKGSGPYFYLPKLENHHEARLWNDIFISAQNTLEIERGTIKVIVLIESILAAFEMDEILYELREHSVGLSAGLWNYIFSIIKKFNRKSDFVFPDRSQLSMNTSFMRSCWELLVQTCHKRDANVFGGMDGFIPGRKDEKVNEISSGLLLDFNVPGGKITEEGIRNNISVTLQFLAAWLNGNGAVAINNLMEDAATAEISRSQLWQIINNSKVVLEGGKIVTIELYKILVNEECEKIKSQLGNEKFINGKYALAREILNKAVSSKEFCEYITLIANEFLE